MNNRLMITFKLFILLIVGVSCGSSSGLKDGIDNKYDLELGVIAEDKVDNFVNRVIQRYGYDIARNEKYSSMGGFYIESYWTEREPFADERSLGYEAIQIQLIFKSKLSRDRSADISYNTAYYDVDVEIRQRGKKISGMDFEKFSFTDEGKDYVKDLAYELKDYITGTLLQ
ncbi:MAG: hypothetical protein JXR20_05405 [Balneola sp.]